MALKASARCPEIRSGEVEELKAKIASGQYNVLMPGSGDSILDGLFWTKSLDNSIIGDEI